MLLLRSVEKKNLLNNAGIFPFTVPSIRSFEKITFDKPVTFLVGENGSGKSTFLEALAGAIGSTTVGSESVLQDETLKLVRQLSNQLKLVWSKKTNRGFFMRSEDFFGYVKLLQLEKQRLQRDLSDVEDEYKNRTKFAKDLASLPYKRELQEMENYYGDGLDNNSHGEAYFTLFKSRFNGEGVYLLDEPEAPLSPMRQMSFITMLHMMIEKGAQFIIATHSPIILAYPDSVILSFDDGNIEQVAYENLDHVIITRSFLDNPQVYLKKLLNYE